MSRYIDIETIKPRQYENSEVELGVLAYDYDEVNAMPYLDIVHCKDCKHYFSGNWCEILKAESMVENGFCAYGERTEE